MSIVTDRFEKLFGGNAPVVPIFENEALKEKIASKYNTTFFLDLTTIRYAHMNVNCCELTGYAANYLLDGGVDAYVSLWQPTDVEFYINKVIPITMKWLAHVPPAESSNYVFGRTYIIRSKKGDKRKILERDIFLYHPGSPAPVAATGYAVDITQVSDINKTTFFIEDHSRNSSDRVVYRDEIFHHKEGEDLTPKELEVLCWMAEGLSSKQIAQKMHISVHTVNNHRKHMLAKTGCTNSADLVKFAFSRRLF